MTAHFLLLLTVFAAHLRHTERISDLQCLPFIMSGEIEAPLAVSRYVSYVLSLAAITVGELRDQAQKQK